MDFRLLFLPGADEQFQHLRASRNLANRFKAVRKCLGYLQTNPRHPGLNTHKYSDQRGPAGQDVFEAYAQNRTPGAYRVLWCYGPGPREITILAITPHP